MILLTPEEIDHEVAHISPGQIPDYEKVHDVLVDAGACAQLQKVIKELEALEPFDHDTWNFGVAIRKWLEAAKKEIK